MNDEKPLARVEGQPLTETAELPQRPPDDVPWTAPEKHYRIWSLWCPFKKSGFPSVGNFGKTVDAVIVIRVATWKRMVAEIPQLAASHFEVGTEGE